jgi:hypothetical protein
MQPCPAGRSRLMVTSMSRVPRSSLRSRSVGGRRGPGDVEDAFEPLKSSTSRFPTPGSGVCCSAVRAFWFAVCFAAGQFGLGCPFSSIMSHQIASELRWPRLDENRSLWFSQAWGGQVCVCLSSVSLGLRMGPAARGSSKVERLFGTAQAAVETSPALVEGLAGAEGQPPSVGARWPCHRLCREHRLLHSPRNLLGSRRP